MRVGICYYGERVIVWVVSEMSSGKHFCGMFLGGKVHFFGCKYVRM